ncbi:Spc98 family-domain-containing protein [Lineolata rhizophorae]|uniref:Spindle pole body component n=1 Tax=Lineolata rhizophorae TaxID=578093 RepID=A0A6A6P530_9PEZI|nr:Spc98 family-domain-containing protein [Lineolata rhizophorae]
MEWFWATVTYMLPVEPPEGGDKRGCSGAEIINRLRDEAQTGYPDIEEAAVDLSKTAEMAWLRQLSSWVLYGRLPSYGTEDFFIHEEEIEDGPPEFRSNSRLLPKFVSAQTASSILFIGRSLNHIRARKANLESRSSRSSELTLLPCHLEELGKVKAPITSASLSGTVSAIRASLSRNTLQELLPLPKIIQILTLLRDFFLLGRGEFAVALIESADECLRNRTERSASHKPSTGVRGLLFKDSELNGVLSKTWSTLSSLVDQDDGDNFSADEILDLARDIVRLSVSKQPAPTRPSTPGRAREKDDILPTLPMSLFNDVLLSVPTTLSLDISSPLDLFLSQPEIDIYSTICSYLLGIRHSHVRLASLWKETTLRRDHPAPLAGTHCATPTGKNLLRVRRARSKARNIEMRKVWATCSAAVFFLAEAGAYFEGEVILESWRHFHEWLVGPSNERPGSRAALRQQGDRSASGTPQPPDMSTLSMHSPGVVRQSFASSQHQPDSGVPLDPESLAAAHKRFLSSIVHALLLSDLPFTTSLRALVSHTDQLVAFFARLRAIQTNLDLEEDEGVVDALADYANEEKEVKLELDRARKRIDGDLKALVGRLREVDVERVSGGPGGIVGKGGGRGAAGRLDEKREYEPWKSGGVDRLLMKLDFGSVVEEEDEGAD